MTTVAIVKDSNSKLTVSAPYNPDFPARAERLGVKWDAARRAWTWTFDARDAGREVARIRARGSGRVVAEETHAEPDPEVDDCDGQQSDLDLVELEVAAAEGRLAGLRFRASELRAA